MKENPLFKKKKRKQKTLDLISHISLQTVTAITEKKKKRDQILEERVRETWRDSYIPLLRIPRRVATPIQTRRMGIFTLSHHSILIQPSSLFFHCFLFEFCEPRRERERSQPQKLSKQNIWTGWTIKKHTHIYVKTRTVRKWNIKITLKS